VGKGKGRRERERESESFDLQLLVPTVPLSHLRQLFFLSHLRNQQRQQQQQTADALARRVGRAAQGARNNLEAALRARDEFVAILLEGGPRVGQRRAPDGVGDGDGDDNRGGNRRPQQGPPASSATAATAAAPPQQAQLAGLRQQMARLQQHLLLQPRLTERERAQRQQEMAAVRQQLQQLQQRRQAPGAPSMDEILEVATEGLRRVQLAVPGPDDEAGHGADYRSFVSGSPVTLQQQQQQQQRR